jgi:hypothetical protein
MIFRPKTLFRPKALLCTLWLLVNAFLLLKNGIVTSGEAEKYIRQAHQFVSTGSLESSNFRFYFIPIGLLSICIKLRLSFAWMVALQLALNGLATLFFYKTVTQLFPDGKTAFIATILLLFNLPYQAYNSFLQTESIFQSISLLLVCLMARTKQPSAGQVGIMLFSVLVLSVTRPNGLLYWPIVWSFICFATLRKRPAWVQLSCLGLGFALFVVLLNLAMGSGGELDFILPFREQHIICGVPTFYRPDTVATPPEDNSVRGLFDYIFHHFGLFIRLALLKSRYFWGLYRDYFSGLHNLYLIIYFYPPAIAASISLAWWRRHRQPALFCLLAPVLLTWIMVILTCDDWQNRVYLGVSPFLLILGLPILNRSFFVKNRLSKNR